MTIQPSPSVSTFLIADSVFQDRSGKWCVIGVFDRVLARQFPSLHYSLGVFVCASDAEGEYAVQAEFCNDQHQVLAQFGGIKIQVRHRLAQVRFGIQTHNLPIPAPGRYFFRLYFNNNLVPFDSPLDAVLMEP